MYQNGKQITINISISSRFTMATKKHIFSTLEKKSFRDILKSFSSVIENKDTDGASLRAKNEAWTEITRLYNASPHTGLQVTRKQLRRLWMNLKQRQKEALTKQRQHRLATGGGPSTRDAIVDPNVSAVASALIVSVEGAIDSDSFLETTDINISLQDKNYITDAKDQRLSTSRIINLCKLETSTPPQSPPVSPQYPTVPLPSPAVPISSCTPTPALSLSSTAPPPLSQPTTTQTIQKSKSSILEREYKDRQRRANELHELEVCLVKERIREAKAKADLAELLLQHELHQI